MRRTLPEVWIVAINSLHFRKTVIFYLTCRTLQDIVGCMAHLHKKMKKGRGYYYVRETQRIRGKPTVVNQIYLGTAEKILSVFMGKERDLPKRFSSKEFGSVFVLNEVDRAIDLANIVNELTGNKNGVKFVGRREWDKITKRRASIEKARKMLGYEPRVGFKEGVRKTVNWILEHREEIEASARF